MGADPPEKTHRLTSDGLVDRARPLRFSFDGRVMTGFAGDTLASALLANGVRLVGRSFKYHRPRGILSAGPEEPNALVELRAGARREPNTRATGIELYDGLEALSQNRWPSLAFDLSAVNSWFAPFIKAGFYYKTFMWPPSLWEKLYEPLIRRAAGLGRAAAADDPDHYEKAFAFCDVLVIGSGPAGLSAALAAGRAGARVILCEEDFALGGRLLSERQEIEGVEGHAWAARAVAELESLPEVRVMRRTSVFGAYDHGTYGAVERVSDHLAAPPEHEPRQRAWRIVAKRTVVAAGAIERPMVFAGNDRPGVMLAGAVRTYLNRFAVAPGRRAVVCTSGDDAWRTVTHLARAGVEVAAVVESRAAVDEAVAAQAKGARVMLGAEVVGTRGFRSLAAVAVRDAAGRVERIACDLLAMSNGWNPTVHLTCHLGGKPAWDETIAAFVPSALPPGMAVAGAASGRLTLADALADGARLGGEAAAACGFEAPPAPALSAAPEQSTSAPLWKAPVKPGKAFVDLQNDVTAADVTLAHREGFRPVEHLKRYTTLGMATDQGKTSNLPGLAMMAALTGTTIPEVGTTVFRPPYTPVAIGALAGHHRGREFRPTRLTPAHAWADEQVAVFVEAGAWLRAQYFPHAGERDWLSTVNREVATVRAAVGVCDVSTLGKIDIQGADAAEFLERVYVNGWKSLAVGRARYGLMLREDGFVMDDGTTSRLGEAHFLMTTTTANAAKVMQHLEFCHQVLWPELDLAMVSVSEQWAQFSIAGPRSRDVLRAVVDSAHDLSNDAFPHLAAGAVSVGGGIPARLFRISFSGELAYELAVPAAYGEAAIRALMAAGAPFGISPYGTEALSVLRIEKGHVAGAELNGQTTARDLGLQRMMSTKKDFIGRAMAERPALLDPDRPMLAGFKPVDRAERLRA
ncbi:MAG TPA: sarcosine oxidase subunit alpha family protein, partial [Beijerinckiaceae bacterium]|nr:sarcosine oxidase subunit alpha family protein [Beijerinckiaceae bacterium]